MYVKARVPGEFHLASLVQDSSIDSSKYNLASVDTEAARRENQTCSCAPINLCENQTKTESV